MTDQAGNINNQQVLLDINTIARTTTTSLSVSSTQTSSSSTEKTSTVLTETSVISSTFNIIQTSPGFEVFLFIITLLGLIIDKRIIRNHKKN